MTENQQHGLQQWHGTTILSVRKNGKVVVVGDGQVSMGQTVMKWNARKVRQLHDGSVIGGFALGVGLLVLLAWVLARYSVKLPIAKFFSITTYLLLALAFILMGKAVSALQEAALIGITPLPVSFEIDWIGVKSSWQGILAQLSVLLVFMLATGSRKKASCATPRTSDFENPGVAPSKPD